MIRSIVAVAVLAVAFLSPAHARKVDLTTEQSIVILDALMNKMDTYDKVVTEGGRDRVVKTFYQLEGNTRMAIARNIAALQIISKAAEKARGDLVAAMSQDGKISDEVTPKLNSEWRKILDTENPVDLIIISEGELKLKENPYPPSLLATLLPILAALP